MKPMKLLPGGYAVIPHEGVYQSEGTRSFRVPISEGMGAREMIQTISLYDSGRAPSRRNPFAEEVLYVVGGFGVCRIDDFAYPLRPGMAVYIPPRSIYQIRNTQENPLEIVSVACPEDRKVYIGTPLPKLSRSTPPKRTVLEDKQEIFPACTRTFKVLAGREQECALLTQFIGVIPPGRASMHSHPYEETIYILEGKGRLKTDEGEAGFSSGTSIYVERGVNHCLENDGAASIRLLGVFHPAAPPAGRYEE